MAGPLPGSYRKLGQFARRYPPKSVVYEQGSVPEHCYLVLKGRIDFEVVGDDGSPQVVGSVAPGEPLGHVAFFTGRPTSALARVAEESVLLAIERGDLPEAINRAPELAITLIEAFALPPGSEPRQRTGLEAGVATERPPEPAAADDGGGEHEVVRLDETFDETMFFKDTGTCPVSGTRFEYLRVRTSAVRPMQRDTDFQVTYRDLDPTHYAMVVCPRCGYAAAQDDFQQLTQEERATLWERRQSRIERLGGRTLNGTRTPEDVIVAIELAMECYEARRSNERRRAVLLHRRAWIDRERGDVESEVEYLRQARDAYQLAYERDTDISDDAAMRAAYLIGDLTLRLGDAMGGARWLETATRYPQANRQTGLARMARERLQDARDLLAEQTTARQAS